MDLKMLAEPFPSEDIEWRAGALMPNEDKCLALAYVTNRAIMNRLDEVCDPDGWSIISRRGELRAFFVESLSISMVVLAKLNMMVLTKAI